MWSHRILLAGAFCASITQVAATPNPFQCNADYCLRALRGLASKSYTQVSTDCANYVWTTVTPPCTTITETSTSTETIATEIEYTVEETMTETTTQVATTYQPDTTVIVTQTNPDPHVATITQRAIGIDIDVNLGLIDVGLCVILGATACTGATSPVPTYASKCTSGVRYASACSCFGVPASAVTVPASTSTVYTTVTETALITSSVPVATNAVTETVTESSTTTIAVAYTAFAIAVSSEAEGWNDDLYRYMDLTYGIWELWDGTGGPMILQPDGKMYYPHNPENSRWYAFCTKTHQDDFRDPVFTAPEGAVMVNSFDQDTAPVGQELFCNWGSDNIVHCSCTVEGVEYNKWTYEEDDSRQHEIYLRSGDIPAGSTSEWEFVATAFATDMCAASTTGNCAGWHDPDAAPAWTTSTKRKRTVCNKRR